MYAVSQLLCTRYELKMLLFSLSCLASAWYW